MPFTADGSDRKEWRGPGVARKPYCRELPLISEDSEDWAQFYDFLEDRGACLRLAKLNAWYPSRQAGDDMPRVVIPATSRDPSNQFWQARLLFTPGRPDDPSPPKRYQSPHAARGDAIIVTHPDEDAPAGTVLVEGPFDALAASELGFVGVALMGNTPSDEVLNHAAEWLKAGPPALFCPDGDAMPQTGDLVHRLLLHHGVNNLRVVSVYPCKDLAEMSLDERRRAFRDAGVKV